MRRAPRGSHRAPIIGRSSEGSPSRCSPAFSKRRAKQRKQAGQRAALFRRRPKHPTRDQCRRTKPAYALVRLIRLAHEAARSGVPASATASGPPPGRADSHASEKCGRHMASAKHGKPREEIAIAAPCASLMARSRAFPPPGLRAEGDREGAGPGTTATGARHARSDMVGHAAEAGAAPPESGGEGGLLPLIRRTARLAVRAVHRRPIHSMPRRPEIRRRPDEERRGATRSDDALLVRCARHRATTGTRRLRHMCCPER